MPTMFSNLFSTNTLLQIFDRVFSHDVFDLRIKRDKFSFLSPVGLIILFIVVFLTAHITDSKAAINCSFENLIEVSNQCRETWLALSYLLGVIAIGYVAAILFGKYFALLRSPIAVIENSCSLFILSCLVLIGFYEKNSSNLSAFNWISDLAQTCFGTSGTFNNIVGVAVVSCITILFSTIISISRRYIKSGAAIWGGIQPSILVVYYLIFVAVSLLFTFYEIG